ncbi:hypothetical protein [Streptomyces rhizosphaericus]|uniref:Uncharacterized protein n=1 Tax=Streptomyces rhizosphaericus TaxID=114699 RepID=A0A6G4AP08_9ACTN|nr:hypothetical protein [Streptomyces rhizosphaericus]NEW74980.1 hypothetical protein [Streptomyces rhizosphaericus]
MKRWLAFIERGITEHMQFGLIHPDGTPEQLPCADWCYACRVEKAEAAIARVRALRQQARTEAPDAQGPTWEALDIALDSPAAEQVGPPTTYAEAQQQHIEILHRRRAAVEAVIHAWDQRELDAIRDLVRLSSAKLTTNQEQSGTNLPPLTSS